MKPRDAFSKQSDVQKCLKPSDSFENHHHSFSPREGEGSKQAGQTPRSHGSARAISTQLLCYRCSPESHSPGIKLWHTLELKWFAKITIILLCNNSCDIILPWQMDFLQTKKNPHPDGTASPCALFVLERERVLLEGTEKLFAPAPQHWQQQRNPAKKKGIWSLCHSLDAFADAASSSTQSRAQFHLGRGCSSHGKQADTSVRQARPC